MLRPDPSSWIAQWVHHYQIVYHVYFPRSTPFPTFQVSRWNNFKGDPGSQRRTQKCFCVATPWACPGGTKIQALLVRQKSFAAGWYTMLCRRTWTASRNDQHYICPVVCFVDFRFDQEHFDKLWKHFESYFQVHSSRRQWLNKIYWSCTATLKFTKGFCHGLSRAQSTATATVT